MATERLYYGDPLLTRFEATVVAHRSFEGRPSVILDRTAFYPEAGGQMADHGRLGNSPVVDVQADESEIVHHLSEGNLPAIGSIVEGEIDRGRRRVHMALHTGQHILSRALIEVAGAETVSSRLGETSCTIDVDLAELSEPKLAGAEDLTNSVIEDDVSVRAYFPEPEELSSLPLRRKPKVTESVRVVQIGAFDMSPCGGTHCLSSAQVGLVRVSSVERYKGGTRIHFEAGRRAREQLAREADLLRSLGRDFTCGVEDVPLAVEKLKRVLSEARDALGHARARLAQHAADELVRAARDSGERFVVAQLEGATIEILRAIASRVTELDGAVALLAGSGDDGVPLVVVRAKNSDFDCGAFVKRAAQAGAGRGGGRPERAEGRLPKGADWPALVRSILSKG